MRLFFIGTLPISIWATGAAWRGPPPPAQHIQAVALHRPISPAAREHLLRVTHQLNQEMALAQAQAGHPIGLREFEATGAAIPDNPFISGIATCSENCGDRQPLNASDWFYCPSTQKFRPNIPAQLQKEKE